MNKENMNLKESGDGCVGVWRGEREGRNVIKIQSRKQTVKIKENDM